MAERNILFRGRKPTPTPPITPPSPSNLGGYSFNVPPGYVRAKSGAPVKIMREATPPPLTAESIFRGQPITPQSLGSWYSEVRGQLGVLGSFGGKVKTNWEKFIEFLQNPPGIK